MKPLMMNKVMNYHKKMNHKFKRIKNNIIKDLKMIKILKLINQKIKNNMNNQKLSKHMTIQNKYLKINLL